MQKKIFFVSREFADIAEAGGVKDVVNSLACIALKKGFSVTVFLPFYGSTIKNFLSEETELPFVIDIKSAQNIYKVSFSIAYYKKVRIVFVHSDIFSSKKSVYTYTKEDEMENPLHVRGTGFEDVNILNVVFQKAVLQWCVQYNEIPEIFHCHDAACSLVPFFANTDNYLKNRFSSSKFFITIHNAGPGYRHQFYSINEAAFYTDMNEAFFKDDVINGQVEPYLLSEKYSCLLTVSPWYADELLSKDNQYCPELSKEFIKRKTKIYGITNGIDWNKYNPEKKECSHLDFSYNPLKMDYSGKILQRNLFIKNIKNNTDFPGIKKYGSFDYDDSCVLFSYHGRLVRQKGIEIFTEAAIQCMKKNSKVRFIVTGQGENELEKMCIETARQFQGKFLYLNGYEGKLARICVAVSDYLVMPSLFEPCGLEDYIAQFFGTVPVTSLTGGLNKIVEGETGFHFSPCNADALYKKILELSDLKIHNSQMLYIIIQKAVKNNINNYNWDVVFENYQKIFFGNEK